VQRGVLVKIYHRDEIKIDFNVFLGRCSHLKINFIQMHSKKADFQSYTSTRLVHASVGCKSVFHTCLYLAVRTCHTNHKLARLQFVIEV